jgi:hypothetical protein
MTTDELAEFLSLKVENAVDKGVAAAMDKHEAKHRELESRLDDTRKHVWMGMGIASALSVGFSKIFGSH